MREDVFRVLKKKFVEEKLKVKVKALTLTFCEIIEEKGEIILEKLYF